MVLYQKTRKHANRAVCGILKRILCDMARVWSFSAFAVFAGRQIFFSSRQFLLRKNCETDRLGATRKWRKNSLTKQPLRQGFGDESPSALKTHAPIIHYFPRIRNTSACNRRRRLRNASLRASGSSVFIGTHFCPTFTSPRSRCVSSCTCSMSVSTRPFFAVR